MSRNRTWIVLPAFNAEKTLEKTVSEIPREFFGRILLVDDASQDSTVSVAKKLGLKVIEHDENSGYGANQKTCYTAALELGAEIIVMLHPDNQYDGRVVGIMSDLICLGNADVVIGNRIRNRQDALAGGMPVWKYILNRSSTLFENVVLGQTIGDFHSGLRAYSKQVLETIPFEENSDDFSFDQELLVQLAAFRFRTGEVPVPVKYREESSSIDLADSLIYGISTCRALMKYLLFRVGFSRFAMFSAKK